MKGLKVLCLLLVVLKVSGSSLTKHKPKDVEDADPEVTPKTSPSPVPTTPIPDIEPFSDPDEDWDPMTTPDPAMEDQTETNPELSTDPSPKEKLDPKPSLDPDPEEQTEAIPSPSTTSSPETEMVLKSSPGDPEEERQSTVDSIPTTTPKPDEDSRPDTNPSAVSSPKPNHSSKTKLLSSLKSSPSSHSKLTFGASQPHVNKQKPGGPNPESRSQLGALGNGFSGFGIPQSSFPINPRPILTGAGETGINHFPLSGDPTFVELPFQDNFNTRQPSRGISNSLQPLPVSSNGEVFPGSFNDGSQGQGLEIPVNTDLLVNSPNNRPQNPGLFGVPSTGSFDFGRPFGNPTNEFGDSPVILSQRPGFSGFPQGTTPQPPLFFNSRPGSPGSFTPSTPGSPSLFLNPNNDNSFPRPNLRPFPPRPSNPPPLFLNPVTQNPASRPSVFLNPQPVNPFIPEDRIPFSLNPNAPNDPSSIFFNSVDDTHFNDLSPDRPSVLFLNPDGDVSPPRVPPSIFLNPQDSPSIFTGSTQPPSRFPLGPTTPSPSLFPRPTTPSPFSPRPTSPFPFSPRPTSPLPFSPRPTSPLPFSPRPTPLPFSPRPTSPLPFSPRPTSPLPFSPRPTPSPFSPRPNSPSPFSPSPFTPRPTPLPFSPRPTSPSPFSPSPSFLPSPGISINSNGNSLSPTPLFPNPTLTPSLSPQGPFFQGLNQIPRRHPVRPPNQFNPVSTTAGPSIIVSGGNNRPTLITPVPVSLGHGNAADSFPHESRGSGFSLQPPKHNYGEGPEYSYGYSVEDPVSGDFHGAEEEKGPDGVVRGSYHLLQPDGKTRVVNYSADDYNGFQADVKYLPPSYR
ncbi:uncharacterized protein [Palaemon carinicauda]|uniref:uncharacterized protein n=1 Tax=Palaemon carinicauda TaxID=392227 RepID=UPI0035B6070C